MSKVDVSKVDAARSQLESEIKRYDESDWIGAITLAGAAEEILPKRDGKDLFTIAESAAAGDEEQMIALKRLNFVRNWLKHSGDDHPKTIEIERTDAALMIVRAMTRFHAVTGQQTPVMDRFERSFRETYPQFVEGRRE
jgi:hypothetical protein